MKRKRLLQSQKELLLQWIAEGQLTDEINKRAAKCAEPFHVSRQQVDYYRKRCDADIKELQAQAAFKALNTGLALKDIRVDKLKELAALIEQDLFGGKLWLEQKKGVGTGPIAEIYEYLEFNRGQVEAYRGLLDDIAKELGHRSIKTDVSVEDDGEYRITFVSEHTRDSDGA